MSIRVLILVLLLCVPVVADQYGTTATSGTGQANGDFTYNRYLFRFTVGSTDQIPDTLFLWIYDIFDTTNVHMALYRADTTLIAFAQEREVVPTTDEKIWLSFDILTSVTLLANTEYMMALHGAGDAVIRRFDAAGEAYAFKPLNDFVDWGTWGVAESGYNPVVEDRAAPIYLNTHDAVPDTSGTTRRRRVVVGQ